MSILDRLLGRAQKAPVAKVPALDGKVTISTGRQSVDFDGNYLSGWSFLPRRAYTDTDMEAFLSNRKGLSYAQIFAILADLDPDLSLALHNYIRLVASDYKVSIYKAGSDKSPDSKGQKITDAFLKGVNLRYGGINNLIGQLTQAGYLQGAMSAEAVFDTKTMKVCDIAPINPYTISFMPDQDNQTIAPYQYQLHPNPHVPENQKIAHNYVAMNPLTFWYVPVDPAIGDPYGRSPATAAIADIFFMMRVMYDLRKVIHNQGWPRIGVTIMTDILKKLAPEEIQEDETRLVQFINARIGEIQASYNDLKPDDSYVHTDGVTIEMIGETSRGALMDPSALLLSIERRIFRGLKQLPILMGSNEGTTETHGTVQFAIYAKGIEAFQKMIEDILEGIIELMLRMEGMQCEAEFEFERVRSTDRLLDAQSEQIEIANEISKVDEGWIDNDQASLAITGSKAVGEPKPDPVPVVAPLTAKPKPEDKPKANARSAPKKAKRRLSLAGQSRRFEGIRRDFENRTSQAFKDLETAIPAKTIVMKLLEVYPYSPENTIQANAEVERLSLNNPYVTDKYRMEVMKNLQGDRTNPVYNTALDIVSKYFEGETVKNIIDGLSEDGAAILTAAYENYAQNVLIRLGEKDEKFAYARFRLDDPGQQELLANRAAFFPQSSFETAQGDIAATVMNGYKEAKSVGDIATDLRGKFEELQTSRSETIANTELNWATSQGTLTTARMNGVTQKRWQTSDNIGDECGENEDAGPIGIDDTFPSGDDAPPQHPNCRCVVLEVVDEAWAIPDEPWTGGE